jgi:uncharacterized membrane protein
MRGISFYFHRFYEPRTTKKGQQNLAAPFILPDIQEAPSPCSLDFLCYIEGSIITKTSKRLTSKTTRKG